jgi:LPXTG-site transpeptidase (sortase) family protein
MRSRHEGGGFVRKLFMFALLGGIGIVIFLIGDALVNPSTDEIIIPTPNLSMMIPTQAPLMVASSEDEQQPIATPTLLPGTYDLHSAQLIIPSVAVNTPIIQVYLRNATWDVSTLGTYAGHLQGTTWLSGVRGNIVLSGHVEMRDGRQGVFAGLDKIEVGALIILQQGESNRRYQVTEITSVAPTDLEPVRPTESERLTLITCDDYDFFSDAYLNRTVIIAEPIG